MKATVEMRVGSGLDTAFHRKMTLDAEDLKDIVIALRLWAWNGPTEREEQVNALADQLQFDDSGRCELCGELQGGDRKHRCWE
jgi:hypothetical protein